MTTSIKIFSGTLLSLTAATGLVACDRDEPGTTTAPPAGQGTTSVDEIKDEPAQFIGKTVTISGEIERVQEPRVFQVEGAGWLWNDEVTVMAGQPVRPGGQELQEGDDVIVTGTVRKGVVVDLEREIGWDLQAEIETTIEDQPVVIASSVRKVDEAARWTADAPDGVIIGLATITMAIDPDLLVGQRVELESVPVRTVRDKALWVGPSHTGQILVVPTEGAASSFKEGDRVNVNGTLKTMPSADEAVKTFGLSRDLRTQIAEEKLYVEGTVKSVAESQARR